MKWPIKWGMVLALILPSGARAHSCLLSTQALAPEAPLVQLYRQSVVAETDPVRREAAWRELGRRLQEFAALRGMPFEVARSLLDREVEQAVRREAKPPPGEGAGAEASGPSPAIFLRAPFQLTKKAAPPQALVDTIAFTPDGQRVFLSSSQFQGFDSLWDAQTGKRLVQIDRYSEPTRTAAFTADGQRLASNVYGGALRFTRVPPAGMLKGIPGLAFRSLMAGAPGVLNFLLQKTVRLEGKSGLGASTWANSMEVSPDGKRVATLSREGKLRLWTARGRELSIAASAGDPLRSASYLPNGKLVTVNPQGDWVVRDGVYASHLVALQGRAPGRLVATSGDGGEVIGLGEDGGFRVWDTATGAERLRIPARGQGYGASFSPDGKQIVIVDSEGARLFEAGGKLRGALPGTGNRVWSATFSPEGILVTRSSGDLIQLWDPATGAEMQRLEGSNLRIAPGGRSMVLVKGDGSLEFYHRQGLP